jgi:hypothetical protein
MGDLFASPWRLGELRAPSAAQVQARTQQQAAEERQSEHVLVSTHGWNLAALSHPLQERPQSGLGKWGDGHFSIQIGDRSILWSVDEGTRHGFQFAAPRELPRHLFG